MKSADLDRTSSRGLLNTQDRVLSRVEYTPQDDLLDGVAGANTFASFAAQMRLIDGKPSLWQWIGVIVGTTFTLDRKGQNDLILCEAMLEPFRDWMRAARKG